jgi:hypothetical protein
VSEFFHFMTLISTELWDLFLHYKAASKDEAQAAALAMRMARRVSDEIALREIGKP